MNINFYNKYDLTKVDRYVLKHFKDYKFDCTYSEFKTFIYAVESDGIGFENTYESWQNCESSYFEVNGIFMSNAETFKDVIQAVNEFYCVYENEKQFLDIAKDNWDYEKENYSKVFGIDDFEDFINNYYCDGDSLLIKLDNGKILRRVSY